MKLRKKNTMAVRCLCLLMAMMLLFTGCASANTGDSTLGNNTATDDTENVTVETGNNDVVGDPSEEDDTTGTEETPEPEPEPEFTAEQLLWQTRLIANVEGNLNVRKSADVKASIVGKMASGAVATIIEKGEEWTHIKSGNVEGYVSNQYCLYGDEALARAKELYQMVATSTTDGLRVRAEMNTDSKIVKKLKKGDNLPVNKEAEVIDGWVAVVYKEQTCYVSADYVTVDMNYVTALTKAEIKQKEEEEAERKAWAALEKITDKRDRNLAETKLVCKKLTDLEVLAAIIFCEAGGENYETKLAVGAVVMNRVKSSKFPNNIKDVILQKYQFSPVRSGFMLKVLYNNKTTQSCIKAAKAAMAGEDNTKGSMFFRKEDGRVGKVYYGGMVFY